MTRQPVKISTRGPRAYSSWNSGILNCRCRASNLNKEHVSLSLESLDLYYVDHSPNAWTDRPATHVSPDRSVSSATYNRCLVNILSTPARIVCATSSGILSSADTTTSSGAVPVPSYTFNSNYFLLSSRYTFARTLNASGGSQSPTSAAGTPSPTGTSLEPIPRGPATPLTPTALMIMRFPCFLWLTPFRTALPTSPPIPPALITCTTALLLPFRCPPFILFMYFPNFPRVERIASRHVRHGLLVHDPQFGPVHLIESFIVWLTARCCCPLWCFSSRRIDLSFPVSLSTTLPLLIHEFDPFSGIPL